LAPFSFEVPAPNVKKRRETMALTKKSLKAMGLTDEQVESVVEMHTETTDALKAEIQRLTDANAALPDLQKKLEQTQSDLETERKSSWKVKYEGVKEDFEKFKAEVETGKVHAAKESAYRALLKDIGISEKRIGAILRVSDVDGVELDTKGAIKGAEKLKNSLTEEWSDFITTTQVQGAETPMPPAHSGSTNTMTKDEIFKIRDTAERQAKIAENIGLFMPGKD